MIFVCLEVIAKSVEYKSPSILLHILMKRQHPEHHFIPFMNLNNRKTDTKVKTRATETDTKKERSQKALTCFSDNERNVRRQKLKYET